MTYRIATRLLFSKRRFQPVKVFGGQAATCSKDYATTYDTYEEAAAIASALTNTHGIYEFKVQEERMTYEQLENAMEARGYNLAGLTPEAVEAIAEVEGFKRDTNGKYYFRGGM